MVVLPFWEDKCPGCCIGGGAGCLPPPRNYLYYHTDSGALKVWADCTASKSIPAPLWRASNQYFQFSSENQTYHLKAGESIKTLLEDSGVLHEAAMGLGVRGQQSEVLASGGE